MLVIFKFLFAKEILIAILKIKKSLICDQLWQYILLKLDMVEI